MRKRLFEIIEVSKPGDPWSLSYDRFMLVTILLSILPLCVKSSLKIYVVIDRITVVIFCIDYLARLLTADYKLARFKKLSFFAYPFTPLAIVDLLCILPSITSLNNGYKMLKMFRLLRTFRIFKAFRYSKSFEIIGAVVKKEKETLLSVLFIALSYIAVTAIIMFQVEPESFQTLFDALYWSTTALTTVGYGDIYPITMFGKLVSMVSSIVGIAVVALPAGIITGGYLKEIQKD